MQYVVLKIFCKKVHVFYFVLQVKRKILSYFLVFKRVLLA
jgi:hypothetical protein